MTFLKPNYNVEDKRKILKFVSEKLHINVKCAIVAGLFGLSQVAGEINVQKVTHQKEQVMQLALKQYEESESINKIRGSLYRDFSSDKAHEILISPDNNVKEKFKSHVIKITKENPVKYQNVMILTNYYNSIASCVASQLCDRETAERLFHDQGSTFFKNYWPLFCDIDEKWKDRLIENDSSVFYTFGKHGTKKDYYEALCKSKNV